jgi:hypothetical protein
MRQIGIAIKINIVLKNLLQQCWCLISHLMLLTISASLRFNFSYYFEQQLKILFSRFIELIRLSAFEWLKVMNALSGLRFCIFFYNARISRVISSFLIWFYSAIYFPLYLRRSIILLYSFSYSIITIL